MRLTLEKWLIVAGTVLLIVTAIVGSMFASRYSEPKVYIGPFALLKVQAEGEWFFATTNILMWTSLFLIAAGVVLALFRRLRTR
jgi:uncharacterized membrane protein